MFFMDRQDDLKHFFFFFKAPLMLILQARPSHCNLCYLISKIKQLNSLGLDLLNHTNTTFTVIWAERFSMKDNHPSLLTANAETVHLTGKSLWASESMRSELDSC